MENGAMGYSPGSHRLGLAKFSDITRELREEPYPYIDHSEMDQPVWVLTGESSGDGMTCSGPKPGAL